MNFKSIIILFFSLFSSSLVIGNRRRRLLRVGVRPDPPLKPFTNTSSIYISYTHFIRGFINTQGLFNRTALIPSNTTYSTFMEVTVADESIKSKNELSAFVAHTLVASKGLVQKREVDNLFLDELMRNYNLRGYLGIKGMKMYQEASLSLFKDLRLMEAPELVTQDESINWKVSLWNWKRAVSNSNLQNNFIDIAEQLLGPNSCETVFKIYTILKQEWDPKSKQYKGCQNINDKED